MIGIAFRQTHKQREALDAARAAGAPFGRKADGSRDWAMWSFVVVGGAVVVMLALALFAEFVLGL